MPGQEDMIRKVKGSNPSASKSFFSHEISVKVCLNNNLAVELRILDKCIKHLSFVHAADVPRIPIEEQLCPYAMVSSKSAKIPAKLSFLVSLTR